MLSDGTYDVLVVDAELDDPASPAEGGAHRSAPAGVRVDLTILAGPHKGELVTLTAHGLDRDPLDLLAVPGTIAVVDGEPHLTLEA